MGLRELDRAFDKSEDDIKALQSVGQIIGSVLKQLDEDRCMLLIVFRIVKGHPCENFAHWMFHANGRYILVAIMFHCYS